MGVIFCVAAPTEAPRNVEVRAKSSTDLEVLWEAPPSAHWNSEMLSYKVGYKLVCYMHLRLLFSVQPLL